MGKKMKRPLSPPVKKQEEPKKEKPKRERPWWARTDEELIRERYDKIKGIYESSKVKVDDDDRPALLEEAARRDPRIVNLLDLVPRRRSGLERDGDFLLVPLYRSDRWRRAASFIKMKTVRRVRMDYYGWYVWDSIDGKRDVRAIGKRLKLKFGKDVEPLYPRLAKFMAYLENLELVRIENGK
ncbi:MAG: PqqD family protein [Thermoplasmatota archaeon]